MPFSGVSLANAFDVFVFIMFCSVYVCSILWIYGDAATRGMAGWKGSIMPVLFIVLGLVASTGKLYLLVLWPAGCAVWLFMRPAPKPVEDD